jgi:hypothetical protein
VTVLSFPQLDESGILGSVFGKDDRGERGSDTERGAEPEVPSRTFLKRQSQLIVEANTRKKGFAKMPLSKTFK